MKTLFIFTLYISVGCLLFAIPFIFPLMSDELTLAFVFVSAMTIGAGFGTFFGRPAVGALCGLSLYLTICVVRAILSAH
jgi:hypothetical protein